MNPASRARALFISEGSVAMASHGDESYGGSNDKFTAPRSTNYGIIPPGRQSDLSRSFQGFNEGDNTNGYRDAFDGVSWPPGPGLLRILILILLIFK